MVALLLLVAAIAQASPSATAAPAPHPSPCVTPAPEALTLAPRSAAQTPVVCQTPSPKVKEIGQVTAGGRAVNLIGKVAAASTGSISQEQIATRPILRPGEVLEAIPGLVISQHSGGGKANQYYLRGFQLDHGTDLESTVAGVPINLPTHAHGQGYSDINWLVPELVSFVEFKKGPYYADQGDFSTAGAYNLFYKGIVGPIAALTVGGYGYGRVLVANSPRVGAGNLLYGFEYVHDNSTLDRPDNYRKFNGVLRWTRSTLNTDFSITAMGYSGVFDSSDQIPQRLVEAGVIDRTGYIDPTDGGKTYRVALSSQLTHRDAKGVTQARIYGFQQSLDLFSNFTYYFDDASDYYNVTSNAITCSAVYTTCTPNTKQHTSTYTSYCPANTTPTGGKTTPHSVTPLPFSFSCGDQREQQDERFVSGFNISRTFEGSRAKTTVGASVRNDNISTVGLFLTHGQVRYPNGTLSDAHVIERDVALFAETQLRAGSKLRLSAGLRGDSYSFHVFEAEDANSGNLTESILSPKFTAAYAMSPHQELYLDFGDSFHSNDGRGATQTRDPQTHVAYDPAGTAVTPVTPLARAVGEEIGYRYSSAKVNTTLSLWQLKSASELIFDGDHGTTFAGRPTVRRGIELANFYTPTKYLTLDADFATSTARFLTDPNHIGTGVPESLAAVVSAGVTLDEPRYAASLRMRYFGPRTLIEDGSAKSPPSTIFNGQFTAKLNPSYRLSLDVLNIFNAHVADVTYYYGSWLPRDGANPIYAHDANINPALGGAGVNDYHFHPSEARTFRFTIRTGI
ncbi:MAG: TonB-dependent receptor [Candidatus Eremiobacteraeota bacterium]|nr:TonB-dependent receptor [Candidatus Eremiobacteraeota bacterium]